MNIFNVPFIGNIIAPQIGCTGPIPQDIYLACYYDNLHIVKKYIQNGFPINKSIGKNEIIESNYLIPNEFKFLINKKSPPLHFALLYGHFEVIKYLIENGAKTSKMYRYGLSATEIVKQNPYLSFWKKWRILRYLKKQELK